MLYSYASRNAQRGSACLETAICLPFLLVLLTGTIDFLRLVSAKRDLQQAVFEMTKVGYSLDALNIDSSGKRITSTVNQSVNLSGTNSLQAISVFKKRLDNYLAAKYERNVLYGAGGNVPVKAANIKFEPSSNLISVQLTSNYKPSFGSFSLIGNRDLSVTLKSLYWERQN